MELVRDNAKIPATWKQRQALFLYNKTLYPFAKSRDISKAQASELISKIKSEPVVNADVIAKAVATALANMKFAK